MAFGKEHTKKPIACLRPMESRQGSKACFSRESGMKFLQCLKKGIENKKVFKFFSKNEAFVW